MNVRLAAQVLSESVSDGILFTKIKDPLFDGCSATTEFCRMFNNAFDILNARNKFSTPPYKRTITVESYKKYEQFYKDFKSYTTQLKFEDGVLVINLKRNTGFVGLLLGL